MTTDYGGQRILVTFHGLLLTCVKNNNKLRKLRMESQYPEEHPEDVGI